MTKTDEIALAEAPYGSELYAECLRLREAILRKPLGLTLSPKELADDVSRRHFCAVSMPCAASTTPPIGFTWSGNIASLAVLPH